ncbi:hypothetical protein [Streptomyces sp. NPDC046860]|uniref:hypothetical protein n=1 Tax=Streptomyces sp. NPDC046860 TaxID=3154495 RepID=UPI0033E26DA0
MTVLPHSQALASPAYSAGPQEYTFPKAVREGVARAEARNKRSAPETVLVHLLCGFHYELAELQPGEVVG